jgi:hypothetical protein
MKLTQEQIQRLYQFTRQHYVEWYDLQTELVDHLANAIEEQWQQNPKLSFEDALQIEFKKFGVFGFMDVVEKRQMALGKQYNKLVWSHFKDFFSIPKIIGTFACYCIAIQCLYKFEKAYIIFGIILILATFAFWFKMYKLNQKSKSEFQVSGKKWLLKDIIYSFSAFGGISAIPFQLGINIIEKTNNNWISATYIGVFCVSFLLFEYIVIILIPSKAEIYLKETYPEYELANAL